MADHGPDPRPITIDPEGLKAVLGLPDGATGIVIFAHGSGSGRLSPRNNHVAEGLRAAGLGTLLLDLLTPAEEQDRRNVFDIDLLARRLIRASQWVRDEAALASLSQGYFGASTGAAAALRAAASGEVPIDAVVSRGGRPDLAGDRALGQVRAPTLLIVGGADTEVLSLNRQALARLSCEKDLVVVPGATHLFEEPGTLDQVVDHAKAWFRHHLAGAG